MFPNQQGRDSWGSVAGYYGNYGGMGAGSASSWYNRAAGGQPSWMGGAWGGAGAGGYPATGMSGEEGAMMASLSTMSNMEREAADMISFPHNNSRQKLGINSNIYSLYQSKQQSRESSHSSGYMSSRSPGHQSETHGQHPPGHTDPAAYHGHDHYTDQTQQCVQQQQSDKTDSSSGQQEEPTTTMEPDSSTDGPEAEVNDDENTPDSGDDKMQRLLAEHAKMFGVKPEPGPSSEGRKFKYKTAQEELAQLMKLTNEKLFKTTNNRSGLTVDIDETETSSDSVSPPRNPFIITNSLNPRRRGRKPKHYSEILFELGQRGISITKTKQQQQAGHMSSSGAAGGQHTSSREMVVSETGAVSHKASGQQLKCPHCNKILTTSVGLMYHIRLHTGEKPYTCEICSKSFATSSHYHYHIRSHSGEKPYRCDFCGKMYTASGSLRLHLKSHLSRLAANAFGSINNLPGGFNGSSISEDPLHVEQTDFKFGIKQEVSEHFSEDSESRQQHTESPTSNDRSSCDILRQEPKQEN